MFDLFSAFETYQCSFRFDGVVAVDDAVEYDLTECRRVFESDRVAETVAHTNDVAGYVEKVGRSVVESEAPVGLPGAAGEGTVPMQLHVVERVVLDAVAAEVEVAAAGHVQRIVLDVG